MDKPKVGDYYILHSENGNDYNIKIINVNEYRPPDMRYATDVYFNGKSCYDDVVFLSDYFFESQKNKLEKMR